MEASSVLVLIKKTHHVLEVCVQVMAIGDFGHLGLLVEVIVRSQDPEVAIIQLRQMEETLALVMVRRVHHVLEICVHQHQCMVLGEIGDLGHIVKLKFA